MFERGTGDRACPITTTSLLTLYNVASRAIKGLTVKGVKLQTFWGAVESSVHEKSFNLYQAQWRHRANLLASAPRLRDDISTRIRVVEPENYNIEKGFSRQPVEVQDLALDFPVETLEEYKALHASYDKMKKPKTDGEVRNLARLFKLEMMFLFGCDKLWEAARSTPPTPSSPAKRSKSASSAAHGGAAVLSGPLSSAGSDDDRDAEPTASQEPRVSQHAEGPLAYQDFSSKWNPGHCSDVCLFKTGPKAVL